MEERLFLLVFDPIIDLSNVRYIVSIISSSQDYPKKIFVSFNSSISSSLSLKNNYSFLPLINSSLEILYRNTLPTFIFILRLPSQDVSFPNSFPYLSTSFPALLIPHTYTYLSHQRINYRLTWLLFFPRVSCNRILRGLFVFSIHEGGGDNGNNFSQFLERMEGLEARQVGGQREAISRACVFRRKFERTFSTLLSLSPPFSRQSFTCCVDFIIATNHPAILR